jgi:multidrug efflux pump subunit AcrB
MTAQRGVWIAAGVLLLAGASLAAYFIFRSPDDGSRPGPETARATPYRFPPTIYVTAVYPGANALVVADAVATPIEAQVTGVENMVSMTSASANDGTYTLRITFKQGTDPDMAQVFVQNRVSLALPQIPQPVQNTGITVRKKSPEPVLLVSLTSPDGRFDRLYLSNFAAMRVKDELGRLEGVADVVLYGRRDSQIRVWLDVDKLTSRSLTVTDVITALGEQNQPLEGGQVGRPPPGGKHVQLNIGPSGRLQDAEELGDIIIRSGPPGADRVPPAAAVVRLRDVGRVELGGNDGGSATLDGKPAVLLGVHLLPNARATRVSRAVAENLAEIVRRAPDGLAGAVAFDFSAVLDDPDGATTREHLVVDAQLPDSASTERTVEVLQHAAAVMEKTPGVEHVLALTEHPFALAPGRPCLVVGLAPKDGRGTSREEVAERLRVSLRDGIPEASFRLSVPSTAGGYPVYGWPVDFAVEDRGEQGWRRLQQCAQALIDGMSRSGKFSDVGGSPGTREAPILDVNVDRTKCEQLGVQLGDVFNTLQVSLGSFYVRNFNQSGRTWQLSVEVDPQFRRNAADILKLQVKNREGQLVALGAVVEVRNTTAPAVIERYNLYPMMRITANCAGGVSAAEAGALCETMADQELDAKASVLVWRP